MELLLVGLSHRTAALPLREQVTLTAHELPAILRDVCSDPSITEAVLLSTCHRVEAYVASTDPLEASRTLVTLLSARRALSPETLIPHLYHRTGRQVVEHLFRVAAGLDSVILGESEITAQVKVAYQMAQRHGTTDPLLNRLFQKALHCAKLIRSRTLIGAGPASIGSVVAGLVTRVYVDRLSRCEVLLWGAGKAAEATARHLIKRGIGQLWIVNRTQLKAQDLASLCQGGWLSWEQALTHLAHVDIAIVCTQAPHYVIDTADIEAVHASRGTRPLTLIDLAVPRNVDPAVARQPGVHLYNIDDLHTIAQTSLTNRHQALTPADALVQDQVGHFWRWRWWKPSGNQEERPCRSVEAFSLV